VGNRICGALSWLRRSMEVGSRYNLSWRRSWAGGPGACPGHFHEVNERGNLLNVMRNNTPVLRPIAALFLALSLGACGDAVSAPRESGRAVAGLQSASHILRFVTTQGTLSVDLDGNELLDANGKHTGHVLPEAIVRRIASNAAAAKGVAALEARLAADSGYQRRVKVARPKKAVMMLASSGIVPSLLPGRMLLGKVGGRPSFFLVPCEDNPDDLCDDGSGDGGGDGSGDTGGGDLCIIKANAIYAETGEYHLAQAELGVAWALELADAKAFADAVAAGDAPAAAVAAAALLADDVAITNYQIEVDDLYSDLSAAAADYFAAGCS
jgi:hypothetical protein